MVLGLPDRCGNKVREVIVIDAGATATPVRRPRRCGEPADGREVQALALVSGGSAHEACKDRWHVEDVRYRAADALSPDALADEAEVTIRGEPPP
jgi:hypothetical protein